MEKRIQKNSLSQQVVDYLLAQIESGALKPGDRLPGERDFAEQLGISRVPLREAIAALSAIGVLEKRQGDGNYVAFLSPDAVGRILRTYTALNATLAADLFEARVLVEGDAARLAARNATQEDLDALEELLTRMEQAVPAFEAGHVTLADMLELDDAFHLQCAAASHNQFYIQFVGIVHAAGTNMGLYEEAYGKHPEKYFDSVAYHRRLLHAICAHDEQQAEAVMRGHIDRIQAQVRGEGPV